MRLGIAGKFTFIIAPLVCLIMYMEISDLIRARQEIQKSRNFQETLEFLKLFNDLLAQAGKERGNSVLYLAQKVEKETLKQIKSTFDQKYANTYIFGDKEKRPSFFDDALHKYIKDVNSAMDDILKIRPRIEARQISSEEIFPLYNNLTKSLISLITNLTAKNIHPSVSKQIRAFQNFISSKEFLARERGTGFFIIDQKKYDFSLFQSLLNLNGYSQAYLQNFRLFADEKLLTLFEEANKNYAKNIEDLREKMLHSVASKEFKDLNAQDWFSQFSNLIRAYDQIDQEALAHIHKSAQEIFKQVQYEQYVNVFLALCIVIFSIVSIFLSLSLVRGIIRPLRKYVHILNDILQEKYYEFQGEGHRQDEIGILSNSIKHVQTLCQDALRFQSAISSSKAAMLFLNHEGKIEYLNEASKNTFCKIPSLKNQTQFEGCFLNDILRSQNHHDLLNHLMQKGHIEVCIESTFLTINCVPVYNKHKEILAYFIQLQDETAQINIQEEISTIITKAVQGDLKTHIREQDKEGFFKILSEQVNTLLKNFAITVEDVSLNLEKLSKGDLTAHIEKDYKGDFETIKVSSNILAQKLSEIIGQVTQVSEQLNKYGQNISTDAENLSHRTESQASNLEEIAASMEQLSSTVRQNAEYSQSASDLAVHSKTISHQGREIVGGVVKAMGNIENSSQKVSEIISVIDEIAFQTNLLALNASVEAARAGESGKGFAVVAEEVRSLAQRSAQASKEIKELIHQSEEFVKSGVEQVHKADDYLIQINKSIDDVAQIIIEITQASKEQSNGLEDINQALSQLDQMTQQNASLVQTTSSISSQLAQQTDYLQRILSFFKGLHGKTFTSKQMDSERTIH